MDDEDDLTARTDADVAGVQGDDAEDDPVGLTPPGLRQTPAAPAPDAAEIEWAGGAVTKPPHPAG